MISVLVAVYNAEKYIRKCLDSLVAQTYKDFEVFCIDDASTDRSAAIIRDYAAHDPRFHLLTLSENGGQAKARNYGLQHCRGNIITFLDADDWYDEHSLQALEETFTRFPQTDCALLRCVLVYEDGRQEDYKSDITFTSLTGKDAFRAALSWNIHGIYAARKELYRYPYDESCRLYSDDNTTRVHYYISREVRQSDAHYYYLQHSLSSTHKLSTDKMLHIRAADSMRQQLIELHCDEENLSLYEAERWKIIIDCYFFYYKHRSQLSQEERAYCLEAIRQGWQSIDLKRLKDGIRHKIGYIPLHCSWTLFRLEEELYFFLRGLVGKKSASERK